MRNKKKSILIFHPSLVGGGAERMVVHIVNGLDQEHFDVTLALGTKTGIFLKEVNPSVKIEEVGIERLRLIGLVKLLLYFWKKNPDIIFGNWSRYNAGLCLLTCFLPRKVRLVIRETGVPGVPSFKIRKPIIFLYRLFVNRSTVIIAQSKDMYTGIIDVYGARKEKVKIIQNAVDVAKIRKQAKAASSLKKDRINLLAVGRFSFTMQKGFDLLLKTFSQLPEREQYQLTFLGDGEMLAWHQQLAKELNVAAQVSFSGFCSNPYPFLREADVFISSSRHEGFPNVVLEALACGTPVLANNYKGGINEILIEGVNGAFCDIEDPGDVSVKLKQVLKLKANAHEISRDTEQRWDKHTMIEKYNSVFSAI